MADGKRWFKVWTSLLVDMDTASNELVGAWTRLGCRAAMVGSRGTVAFESWDHVGRFLGVEVDRARTLLGELRNVTVEEARNRHGGSPPHVGNEERKTVYGAITVTFRNWTKYQEDSTQAERQKRSRSKRRGESPPPKDKERTTPVVTREVTSSDAAPDPPGDSELASLWEGRREDRRESDSDGLERSGRGTVCGCLLPDGVAACAFHRKGRTAYPVRELVAGIATARSAR